MGQKIRDWCERGKGRHRDIEGSGVNLIIHGGGGTKSKKVGRGKWNMRKRSISKKSGGGRVKVEGIT